MSIEDVMDPPDPIPLACSNCGREDGLEVEVEVRGTMFVPAKAAIEFTRQGEKHVEIEHDEPDMRAMDAEEVDTGTLMRCSHCNVKAWWPPAKGLATTKVEYRCRTCNWWGLQDWLHDPECEGELEKLPSPTTPEVKNDLRQLKMGPT